MSEHPEPKGVTIHEVPLVTCGGIVDEHTTREDLIRRGFTENDAREVIAFRDRLKRRVTP